MTKNRRHKAAVRAHQAGTGMTYTEALKATSGPRLTDVMQQRPDLTNTGIGLPDSDRLTAEQRRVEYARSRAALAAAETSILEAVGWLIAYIGKTTTTQVGSYAMKHVYERATGRYLTNGQFIAAGLIAGYAHRHVRGPNVAFGMSLPDVRAADPSRM